MVPNVECVGVPGRVEIDVTEDNLPDHIKSCLKYRLLGWYEALLDDPLMGLVDVMP